MKLDVNVLRYLSKDDFRVLTAVEMGQKNHEIVPMPLIDSISGLKHGGAYRCVRNLLKHKLVHHENSSYDGYRLTYQGYDFLAIRALAARGHISGVGRKIGVGKESDIYEVMNDEGEVFALKLHRLGRTSFRAVKNTRDYLGKRQNYSWLYLSRLAAVKEFAFMKALYDHGFPVPQAIDNNRHAVLMTLIDARPMVQQKKMRNPAQVYLTCMELLSRLAGKGLIHCDFNEFNLLINDDEEVTIIDFPQMISVNHANAKELFIRDVECIVRFFSKKVGYIPENDPALPYVRPSFEESVKDVDESLDVALAASGFQHKHQVALEAALASKEEDDTGEGREDDDDEEEDEQENDDAAEGDVATSSGSPAAAGGVQSVQQGEVDTSKEVAGDGDGEGPGGDEEGLSGEDDDDEEDSEGDDDDDDDDDEETPTESGRSRSTRKAPAKVFTPFGEREIQATVVAQRRKVLKGEQMQRVSRNSSKQAKGKGTRRSKGGAGGVGGGGDFGGW